MEGSWKILRAGRPSSSPGWLSSYQIFSCCVTLYPFNFSFFFFFLILLWELSDSSPRLLTPLLILHPLYFFFSSPLRRDVCGGCGDSLGPPLLRALTYLKALRAQYQVTVPHRSHSRRDSTSTSNKEVSRQDLNISTLISTQINARNILVQYCTAFYCRAFKSLTFLFFSFEILGSWIC